MPLEFYFALYDNDDPGFYHWALFAVPQGGRITGRVQVFQIVGQRPGHYSEDGYMALHGEYTLLNSGNFLCALRLPSVNMRMEALIEYMWSQPVGRRGTPLIETANNSWSCFQWAMRAVRGLIYANALVTESNWSSYTRNAASYHKWGTAIYYAVRDAANDAKDGGRGLDHSSGVPQINIDRSGVWI